MRRGAPWRGQAPGGGGPAATEEAGPEAFLFPLIKAERVRPSGFTTWFSNI